MTIKINFSESVAHIMNDRRMTSRERVGHLENLCGKGSWEAPNIEKLEALLKWATGKNPPPFVGKFDMNTRVFVLSFDPKIYFNEGGMIYHNEVLVFMNRMKWPYISYPGANFWVGYFPHFKRVEEPVVTNPATPVVVQEEQKPQEQVKAPKTKAAPKAVRNIKRKPRPKYTEVPEEMNADE